MKVPEGCAICGATWGDHWANVEGQRMFFCCEICETEFRNMIDEVKRRTKWAGIDEIKTSGDPRLRRCTAIANSNTFSFVIGFDSEGKVRIFQEESPQ